MRAKAGILGFLCLLLVVGPVAAIIQTDVAMVGNPDWVIANGVDQSTFTVTVTNQSFAVKDATVTFTVNDPDLGTMNPVNVLTDTNGKAISNFKVKTKSGTATITATVFYSDPNGSYIIPVIRNQNIDHDSPYYPYFSYPLDGEVASEIPFNISITDRWGNRIDNKKEVASSLPLHILTLHVHGPAPDDCNFVGYGHDISPALDPDGNLSVTVRLSSKIGSNYILMDQFGSIPDKFEWIVTGATGIPCSMTGSISDGGILPVGTTPFILDYVLYDIYGNPVRNRSIWVNTSLPNEQQLYTSNSLGQIRLSYGPKITVNNITINAISLDNHTVTNQLVAHFINSGPTNMVLAVTPQTMASREVEPSQQAFVRATVIDLLGNPVPGETVKFTISGINYGGFNVSAVNGIPSFNSSSVVDNITAATDNDGNAIVLFYPGSFALRTEPGYSKTANASCTIEAQWNSTNRNVVVSWKNYPYLSIEASATPQSVRLNDTFDVNIRVTGDGYAMGGAPVTAILDQDCSASMKNPDSNGLTRLGSAKEAAKAFVDEMKQGQDYIGLVSFGTDNNNQFHLSPQADLGLVKIKIDSLLQGKQSKMLDESITESINNITTTQPFRPQDEVRAVIVLNDGNNNIDNQGQMNAFVASANSANPKIYIFTVVYLDGAPTNDQKKVLVSMDELANRTGGKLFTPTTPEQLKQAYIDIAGILRTLAGVNATMQVNYQNVEVNSTPMPGKDVFDYVPVENGATSPDSRTTILWPNNTRSFSNQTDEWNTNNQLHFDIGTINISERWETTYRLKANQTGLIKLFDNTSTISFNDGLDFLEFPDLFITVTPNVTPIGSQSGTLDLSDLAVTKSGTITDTIPVTWNLTYSGIATVTETMWYSHNNGPWVLISSQQNINPGDFTHNGQLDVRKLPPGGYRIKIHAVAPDAVDDEEISSAITVGSKGVFIKLE
jgi:hypothetical protein